MRLMAPCPAALRRLAASIVDGHAASAIASDVVFVERALGEESGLASVCGSTPSGVRKCLYVPTLPVESPSH